MQIWLISDTHHFHENMYLFKNAVGERVRAQFSNAAEGDAYMVQAWNDLVKPDDHVWHLGDVTMERGSQQIWKLKKIMASLHGHKRLVLGNHDHFDVRVYRDVGFEKIKGSHRFEDLVYSHIPLHPDAIASSKVAANVHGHTHDRGSPIGKYVSVCVERTAYRPVPVEEVQAAARAMHSKFQEKGGHPNA